jgi:hypothetical protein
MSPGCARSPQREPPNRLLSFYGFNCFLGTNIRGSLGDLAAIVVFLPNWWSLLGYVAQRGSRADPLTPAKLGLAIVRFWHKADIRWKGFAAGLQSTVIGTCPAHKNWRWRQSSANPSLLRISLFRGKIQGNFWDLRPVTAMQP